MSSPAPTLDRETPARAARRGVRARHAHRVQFYDRLEYLCEVVGAHIAAGLADGVPGLIIARTSRLPAFEATLQASGVDVPAARRSGQLQILDAGETLSRFVVNGTPDWDSFRLHVGGLVEGLAARRPDQVPRAYGEMVDLLYQQGNAAAALQLEEYWNELSQQHAFTLLCGYALENFREASDASGLEQVCHRHTDVEPAESFQAEAGAVGLNRQVVLLQQQARALQTELDHRREIEAELWRQNALVSRSAGFSEVFMGALSYDLRSPLLVMVTAAGVMLRRQDPDEGARLAQRILSSAGRMDRMIDQLLDFSRIRLGQGLSLSRRHLDLRPLCQDLMEELEGEHGGRTVSLASRGDTSGFWDRGHLEQVVFTLAGNGLSHGEPDQPVSLILDGSAQDQVVLQVHNGGEIPAALQPLLFQPFKPTETRRLVGGRGLGLGLFLVDQIVRAHGGDVQVASSRASGTRLTVALPRNVGLA